MTDLPTGNSPAANGPRHAWFFACCLGLALLCCWLLWAAASLMTHTLPYFHGKPLPAGTQTCMDYRWWLLAFPLPWLVVAARHVWRGDARATQLVKFSATLVLALLVLSVCVALMLVLPWLPIYLC